MRTDITLNGSTSATSRYVGWAPSPGEVRLSDPAGAVSPVTVTLRNQQPNVGGQLVFSSAPTQPGTDTLDLVLPIDGSPVPFFTAGRFGAPSERDADAGIEVAEASGAVLSMTQLMVRVRKDANTLTDGERDRFVAAFATLNNRGLGRFSEFRDMHRNEMLAEAHGYDGFLPWHRAYLLDLERELQGIDASVTLPYWRFDQPAPYLFTVEFFGETDPFGTVRFAANNPLQFWKTDQGDGINREPRFNAATEPARDQFGPVRTELATLALGDVYGDFVKMEGNPHARAHTSFGGFLRNAHTAPKDPLFFLLHANVDRLWAMWQWVKKRFDVTVTGTYRFLGQAGQANAERIGHNLLDTMWPWNGDTAIPRPTTAPGGPLAPSVVSSAPSSMPTVGEMIDYQGKMNTGARLAFDYDDVPFEL